MRKLESIQTTVHKVHGPMNITFLGLQVWCFLYQFCDHFSSAKTASACVLEQQATKMFNIVHKQ